MKKLFYIAIVLAIAIFCVACGSKKTANTNITNYTKEFSYFPSYNNDMKSYDEIPATKKMPYIIAKYNIKNTTEINAFQNYESILKKDGWTITQDQKYDTIWVKKGTHLATIMIQKNGSDIRFIIASLKG